jgi:hypothetical protein
VLEAKEAFQGEIEPAGRDAFARDERRLGDAIDEPAPQIIGLPSPHNAQAQLRAVNSIGEVK